MAFSLGALLSTAASARAGARRGQREEAQIQDTAVRQREMDMFNEYARRRQLDQTDEAQGLRGELAAAKNRADLEKAQLLAEVNRARADMQYGRGGSVDRTNDTRGNIAGMQYGPGGSVDRTNTTRENVADKNNTGALQRVQITVAGQDRRDNQNIRLADGSYVTVDANGNQVKLPGNPVQSGGQGRVSAATEKRRSAQRQAILELEAALKNVQSANKKGVAWAGPWDARKRGFDQSVRQIEDVDASPALRSFQRITSKEINDLFGAALSAREDARTLFQLPRATEVNEASAEAILREKLALMQKIANEDPDDDAPVGTPQAPGRRSLSEMPK